MKTIKRVISVILLSLLITIFLPINNVNALISRPENIRIGINFKYGATNTTLENVMMSSLGGLELGINLNGTYTRVFETTALINAFVDIKSDSYHVKITNAGYDLSTALVNLNHYKSLGLDVFLVCNQTNTWYIYEGEYYSEQDVNLAINNKLKPKLGALDFSVVNPSTRRILIEYGNGVPLIASESNTAFLSITSNFSGTPKVVNVNGDRYRGTIELRKLEDGDITVINELLLNEYLYGVVPLEIGTTNTPFEALKAQAVAARTYALGNSNFTALGFDLTNTTLSQVYGGYDVENLASNNAVDATAADVVTYGGVLARLYYFSSSGGATANSENVWLNPIPYLRSVADPYDRIYRYEYTYTASEIANHLTANGRNVGDVIKIEIVRVSVSGRVVSMRIYGTLGSTSFTNEACRIFAFPDRLPSQMFTVGTASSYAVKMGDNSLQSVELPGILVKTSTGIQMITTNSRVLVANDSGGTISLIITPNANSDFVITGAGHGHGVGMSQYGAMGMAEAGYTYDQILLHYYTGVRLEEAKLY